MARTRTPRPDGAPVSDDQPSNRGPLMFTKDIRTKVFQDQVSDWWVRRNVAPDRKIRLGHSTVAWFEADVYAWLHDRMGR